MKNMYQYRSEDIELPQDNEGDFVNKYQQDNEENGNDKKKILIVIVVVGGVLILGVIIFLVIYFSNKNKKDGGYIMVKHELDNVDEVTIFNIGIFRNDEYSIEDVKLGDTVSGRLLEEEINYYVDNAVLKFNDNKKRVGIIECKIRFNDTLTRIDGMFKDIKSLISADFSEFISEKIKNMNSLFLNCENLQYTNFNNFNSKKVESMNSAFENCINIYEIDLSSFETPKLRSLKSTFKNCKNLEYINLKNFELNNNIVDRENIFDGDDNLKYIEVENQNTNDLLKAENRNLNNTNITYYNSCEEGKDEKCQKCNDNNKCSSCNEGYYFPNYSTINKCKKCYKGCKICSDYMNCTKCNENDNEKYILEGDKCKIYVETINSIIISTTKTSNIIIENPTNINSEEADITGDSN